MSTGQNNSSNNSQTVGTNEVNNIGRYHNAGEVSDLSGMTVGDWVVIEDLSSLDSYPLFSIDPELQDDFDENAEDYTAVWSGLEWVIVDQDTGGGDSSPIVVNNAGIDYIPTSTGNTNNLNQIVTASDGTIWAIDSEGNGVNLCCGETAPALLLGAAQLTCEPVAGTALWSSDQDTYTNDSDFTTTLSGVGGWKAYTSDEPVQTPFIVEYTINAADFVNDRVIFGVSPTATTGNQYTHYDLIGYRFDLDRLTVQAGTSSDLTAPSTQLPRVIRFEGVAGEPIKAFIDGVERGSSTTNLTAGTDYYPSITNVDEINFTYKVSGGLTAPNADFVIRGYDVGSTYEMLIDGIVVGEFVGEDVDSGVLQQTITVPLNGLEDGQAYTVTVRDKAFPANNFSNDSGLTHDSCAIPMMLNSALFECLPQAAEQDFTGLVLVDAFGNPMPPSSNPHGYDDGSGIRTVAGWDTGGFLPDANGDAKALELPISFTWSIQNGYHDRIRLVPKTLFDATPALSVDLNRLDGFGQYHSNTNNAVAEGWFGDPAFNGNLFTNGAWAAEKTITIDENGFGRLFFDGVEKASAQGDVDDYVLYFGATNLYKDLTLESASFTADPLSVVTVDFEENGGGPYVIVDSDDNIVAETLTSPVTFEVDIADGVSETYSVKSTLNDGTLSDPAMITAHKCNGPNDPYTSMKEAQDATTEEGTVYMEIGGVAFETVINADGWFLVAEDYGDGVGTLPQVVSLNGGSRGVLDPAVLAVLTESSEVRITSSVPSRPVDAVTSDPAIIQRVIDNVTLHQGFDTAEGIDDNPINTGWVGTGSGQLTQTATLSSTTHGVELQDNIHHASGKSASMVWSPKNSYQRAPWSSGEIPATEKLQLWVRA